MGLEVFSLLVHAFWLLFYHHLQLMSHPLQRLSHPLLLRIFYMNKLMESLWIRLWGLL